MQRWFMASNSHKGGAVYYVDSQKVEIYREGHQPGPQTQGDPPWTSSRSESEALAYWILSRILPREHEGIDHASCLAEEILRLQPRAGWVLPHDFVVGWVSRHVRHAEAGGCCCWLNGPCGPEEVPWEVNENETPPGVEHPGE